MRSMDFSHYKTIQLERRGRLLYATLNRPDTLNSIERLSHAELVRFFADLSMDTQTDVAILTGAGRAFSAGGDLDYMQEMIDDPGIFIDDIPDVKRVVFGMLDCPKPIIAKVNGHAIGLGATVALLC